MKTIFQIPIYERENDKFIVKEYTNYEITYLQYKVSKPGIIRVVVNGYLTKQTINLSLHNLGYKHILLNSIREYLSRDQSKTNPLVKKFIKIEQFNNNLKTIIRNYLLPINKEMSRDKLTQFGFVKN